jgi:NTE family protein
LRSSANHSHTCDRTSASSNSGNTGGEPRRTHKALSERKNEAMLSVPTTKPERRRSPRDLSRRRARPRLRLSLALQGGGAFGAFTWGALDRLLEEVDLELDVVSGASAGAINAVLLASGLASGGRDGARANLERFWSAIATRGMRKFFAASDLVVAATSQMSPYQFNPLELNPLRALLLGGVDFEAVRERSPVRLLISATRVQDGAVRLFETRSINLEVVLASACLPRLHHAVEIDGEPHWDGGYSANPPLLPLVAASHTPDVLLVRVIPTEHRDPPVTRSQIETRLGRITFNGPLQKELESIALMRKLIHQEGKPTSRLGRKIDRLRLHHLSAEDYVDGLSELSILSTDWELLSHLRERGRTAVEWWLSHPMKCDRGIAADAEHPTCCSL